MTAPADPDDELDAVIADFLADEEAGAAPDPAAVLAAHPHLRGPLAEFFADHRGLTDLLGPAPPATGRLPAGSVFAGYTVLAEAGAGGAAVVYRARQADPPRDVALKVLHPGTDPHFEQAARLRLEADALGRLAHPHVAAVYAAGVHEGRPYLAAEWLPGGTLEARLPALTVDPRAAAAVVRDLARGVAAAHAAGVLHRDLTPANALFDAAGRVKLVDFGAARDLLAPRGLTGPGLAVGTAEYLAPEQASARLGPATARTDVHGLGAVLFACLTGRPPFRRAGLAEAVAAAATDPPPDVRALNPRVPRDLAAVCGRCLEKGPERRYRSADELADDLDRFLRGEGTHARPPGPARRVGLWARRRPAAASAVAVGLVSAGGLMAAGAAAVRADARRAAAEGRAAVAAATAAAERFFAALERVRVRRADPQAGWTAATLADLRGLAALPLAAAHQVELRSEAALALGGLDLLRQPDLAEGFRGYAVAVHPAEPAVVVAGRAGSAVGAAVEVRVYDPRDGRLVRTHRAACDVVWQARTGKGDHAQAAAVSPDGRWLAVGRRSGRVQVWAWAGGPDPAADHPVHPVGVDRVAFSADGRLLFSTDDTARLRATRLTGTGWALLPGERHLVAGLPEVVTGIPADPPDPLAAVVAAYPPPGPREVTTALAGGAAHVRRRAGRLELWAAGDPAPTGVWDAAAVTAGVTRHAWAAGGRLLAESEEHGRRATLWDMAAVRPAVGPVPTGDGSGMPAFDPAGRTLYVAGATAVARYAVGGADVQDRVGWSPQPMHAFAAAPDGRTLAAVVGPAGHGRLAVFPADQPAAPEPRPLPGQPTDAAAVAAGGEGVTVTHTRPGNRLGRSGGVAGIDLGDEFEHLAADPAGRVWVAAGYAVWRLDPPAFGRAAAWAGSPATGGPGRRCGGWPRTGPAACSAGGTGG